MDAIVDYKDSSFNNMLIENFINSLEYPEILNDRSIGGRFMEVLENGEITTVFQPIISLRDGSILGFEALSRGPKDTELENPGMLFDLARIYDKVWELEFKCRIKALESAAKSEQNFNIFINVDPAIINDEKFKKGFTKEFLKKFNINPENIVFEITEKNSVLDINSFKKVIDNYKDQGYKIAIDDTGSGYSGLKLITDIHPHYIKLDMNLIRDIDRDGLKYALIKTLYEFCLVSDIKVIAEGIETENELNALIDIGVNYAQGYFIKKPSCEFNNIDPKIINIINMRNIKKKAAYHSRPATVFVGDISRSSITVESSVTGGKVLDIFSSDPSTLGLPIVENGKLLGSIMKDKFYSMLGTQYGYALFLNRPITLIMDKRPLSIDYETTIDIASKLAMTRDAESLYDYIVITKNGNYCGIVTVKDLLEKTIDLEVNYAKHLNPLSGLPGNILIEHKLKELVASTAPYSILYIDIDNFKVYNDVYGFENGDRMLQFLGKILTESVDSQCNFNCFIGHVGGDDFVITLESYEVHKTCAVILEAFEKGITDFYTSEHLNSKSMYSMNRHGKLEQFGLVTLSIAGVCNKARRFKDIYELAEHAGKVKKKCKEQWQNCCIIE